MKKRITFLSAALMLLAFLAVPLGMRGQATTLVSGSGTSGYTVPDGWTTSGTVAGGQYLKFDGGTMTSPEFAPHNGLSFTYSVATFGSGTNHPLTIRILNASTDEVIIEETTDTPTSSTYISTGSPLSLGDVTVAFKIQMYGPTGKGVRLRNYSVTGTPAGGQQLTPSDLALVDAPVELEFDLYDNANAQTITYTTSSTGAVTVSQSDYITATVNANNTITMTPVAVTNGPQTITVNQAADNTYAAGSVTFTVDIEDSTPSTGTNVTFLAGTDLGSTSGNNSPDEMEKNGVTVYSTDAAFATAQYRLYKSSVTTISVESGTITKIVFNGQSTSYPVSNLSLNDNNGSYTVSNNVGTWTGNADEVSFTATNGQVRLSSIVVTVELSGTPAPSYAIENNDEIAYDATSGSFTFTVNNPVDGGETTVAEDVDWISNAAVSENTVTFTTTQNDVAAARSGIITLTYTYNTNETISKDVTVTQAGNPNVVDNISDITEVGVNYRVKGMVVATSSKGFIIGDGTGYVYTYMGNTTFGYAVGDNLSISGTTGSYGQIIQFTSSATIETVDETNYNGEPEYTVITEVPDYTEGYHLSNYFQFEGALTSQANGNYTNYYIALGESTICISYPTADQQSDLEALLNKTVRVHGFFAGISSTTGFTVMMESVEEVAVPSITLSTYSIEATAEETEGALDITYENLTITDADDFDIQYYNAQGEEISEEPDWILVEVSEKDLSKDDAIYEVSYIIDANEGEARSAYFKVYAMDDETNLVYSNLVTINQAEYVAPVASITVDPTTVNVPAEGAEGTLTVTYENITEVAAEVWFCDAAGTTEVTYDWITADINNDNNVEYLIESNDGEARTAYFKVYALDNNANDVYSDLVTINQAEYVAPAVDYATLPFNWGGGTAEELLAVQGVTANGLGSNYAASNAPYRVKFDGTGDYIQVKTDTNPDYVIVNVKMLGGSNTSSITVQASADGETFDEGEALTISGAQNDILELISTRSFDESVRYIRLYFTKGSNVGVGPITIAKYESYPLAITGYGDSEGGYVLLASPVYANPANTGMITDDGSDEQNLTYDFYYFDQSQELEWINYREHPFNIVPGKGYLYANKIDVDLTFTGVPYSGDGQIALTYDANAEFAGWNLVGNPFGNAATIDKAYYKLKEDGSDVNPETENSAIDVMEGVFVVAETNGETVTFTEQTTPNNDSEIAQMNINVSKSRGESVDRAIVRFDNGNQLPKFQLNPNHTKVYIPQGNNDYAIVRSDAQGEMPVNFKAQSNGTYTISINAENVEMEYLHLIDNMTGADVDLLATPSYTFDANTTDYASRFHLVFSANNVNDNTTSETFAYFNGSEWSISNTGRATLQVVDVLGRIVSSESINGNTTLSTTSLKDGVYIFRLVNGENVKVQKVVVK